MLNENIILLQSEAFKMSEKKNTFRIIAKTFDGLEDILAKEIESIGGDKIRKFKRAIEFWGDKEILYKTNYLCRTVLRVIKPIASFTATSEDILYNEVKKIDWKEYMNENSTFAIDGITSHSNISHSKYLAYKTKDAIVDQFREETGNRPNVEKDTPDLRINVRIFKNHCTISLDSSGESLHRRGYRQETGPAPLNEVLAAGMILLTGWDGTTNFIDPMCGSGTLPIEAAMIARNMPAGYYIGRYAFERWNDFDAELWQHIKTEAESKIRETPAKIIGSDWSGRILQIAHTNVRAAGLEDHINLMAEFISDFKPPPPPGILVTNPPYGERIKMEDIVSLYTGIGDSLKQNFTGYQAWIISSHLDALKHIGLRSSARHNLFNGPIECRYVGYDLFEGSKRDFDEEKREKTKKPPKRDFYRKDESGKKREFKRKRIGSDNDRPGNKPKH